jgi:hypothetical protein
MAYGRRGTGGDCHGSVPITANRLAYKTYFSFGRKMVGIY